MPPEGFVDPVTGDGTRFCSNVPASELTEHVTRAIKSGGVNSTPPIAETVDEATITKMSRPSTKPLLCAEARGKLDLHGDRMHGRRMVAKILRKGYVRIQEQLHYPLFGLQ